MYYRTRAYIAGEWDGDRDLIEQLHKWNESNYWGLHFLDAHDLKQSRDSSLSCTIKDSLRERLNASKTFALVVGANTLKATAGSCQYCQSYSGYTRRCYRGKLTDFSSFIEYECEYARKHELKVVVLYNYLHVHREKCPESLRYIGNHIAACYEGQDGRYYWDYQAIRKAIEG